MRVLVLGATGRTGKRIAARAREAGHEVLGFGRSASVDTLPAGVQPVAGNVLEPDALAPALEGADAVITALSIPRRSASPFASLVGPPDLHSRSTALLLPLMERRGVRRLVKLSAQGVGDSASRTGWGVRLLVATSTLRIAYGDHAVADERVFASNLDWTVLRPPVLTEVDDPTPLSAGETLSTWTWTRVSREAVAAYAVDCLTDPETVRRCLTLAPGTSSSR